MSAERVGEAVQRPFDVRAIRPQAGARYSPNLYQWLTSRKRPHRTSNSRVYQDGRGALWIGFLDLGDLIGQRLIAVLCRGSSADSACWVNLGPLVEVADFWERYARVGRCAIDTGHSMSFIGDEGRWSGAGDRRMCNWCGCWQARRRWTETVERERWEATSTASGKPHGAPETDTKEPE